MSSFEKKLREGSSVKVIGSTTNKGYQWSTFRAKHLLEVITQATGRVIGLNLIGTVKSCEDCALRKNIKVSMSKEVIEHSKMLGERVFFDIASPLTPTYVDKKHWLLVIEDITYFA